MKKMIESVIRLLLCEPKTLNLKVEQPDCFFLEESILLKVNHADFSLHSNFEVALECV